MSFTGIPHAAADFYADLEQDNTREFWARRGDDYRSHVRGPMLALLAEVEPDFGPAKIFRPHRDVRFAADKSPYKTHQGGFIAAAEATGDHVAGDYLFVEVDAGHWLPELHPDAVAEAVLDRVRHAA